MHFKSNSRGRSLRAQQGSMAILLPCAILLIIVGIGAFAMDISHNVTVRTELQSASDAGALAGAKDLLSTTTINNVDDDVLTVAARNTADGKSVSNLVAGFTVLPQSQFDNSTNSGTCTVDATKTINNIFAKIFGHNGDSIRTHSVAQAWRSITGVRANQMFPLTVSLDTLNGHNGVPLSATGIGGQINFEINSQQWKNAAFTSFTVNPANADYIKDAVAQLLGFSTMQPGFIPAMNVTDDMYLINGVAAEKALADGAYISALTAPGFNVLLPVMTGDPPYNQTRECVGFVTVHINGITTNQSGGQVESFNCTLVKGLAKGTGGVITGAGSAGLNAGMQNISAGTIQLVN